MVRGEGEGESCYYVSTETPSFLFSHDSFHWWKGDGLFFLFVGRLLSLKLELTSYPLIHFFTQFFLGLISFPHFLVAFISLLVAMDALLCYHLPICIIITPFFFVELSNIISLASFFPSLFLGSTMAEKRYQIVVSLQFFCCTYIDL